MCSKTSQPVWKSGLSDREHCGGNPCTMPLTLISFVHCVVEILQGPIECRQTQARQSRLLWLSKGQCQAQKVPQERTRGWWLPWPVSPFCSLPIFSGSYCFRWQRLFCEESSFLHIPPIPTAIKLKWMPGAALPGKLSERQPALPVFWEALRAKASGLSKKSWICLVLPFSYPTFTSYQQGRGPSNSRTSWGFLGRQWKELPLWGMQQPPKPWQPCWHGGPSTWLVMQLPGMVTYWLASQGLALWGQLAQAGKAFSFLKGRKQLLWNYCF